MDLERIQAVLPSEDESEPTAIVGETIAVRDLTGRKLMVIGICADGQFLTDHGKCPAEDLGEYIQKITGHPSAR